VVIIEKAGGYHGVYHVLGGAICPLEGVGPDSLTITPLIDRVAQGCTEIIFALSQTPEGEATASYIASKVVQGINKDIKISCLARGLPVGASLEIMDRLTVFKALAERRPF
jgi:recombination protein RecR